jgi:hypothetical protein
MSYFTLSRDQSKLLTDFMSNVRPGVELEIRFGNFMYNKDTKKSNFVSNVEQDFFYRLKKSFTENGTQQNIIKTTEYIYQNDKGNIKRILNMNDNSETTMLKNTFKKYDIYDFDFRLSLAKETVIQEDLNLEKYSLVREKTRTSFVLPFGSLDLTIVKETNVTNVTTVVKHEVELEITNVSDSQKYIEQILAVILQTRQDNFFVISNYEKRNVLNQYKQLVNSNYFIGVQPETLQKNGLSNLYKERYSVTDKADGERMFLFITKSKDVYFIDNNLNRVMKTNVKSEGGYFATLMDGELVINSTTRKIHFLVFDLMVYNEKDIRGNEKYMLDTRINRFNHIVSTLNSPPTLELYKVEAKKFYYKNVFLGSEKLLDDANNKFYKNDGLIFTPMDEPYPLTKKWTKLLKWKPAELNTIDFYSVKIDDNNWELYVQHTAGTNEQIPKKRESSTKVLFDVSKLCQSPTAIDKMTFQTTFDNTLKDMTTNEPFQTNTVIEYRWDNTNSKFVPLRTRWDKTSNSKKHGNFSAVACDVWNNIHNPIHKEDLFRFTVFSNTKQDFFFERMRKSHNKVKEYLYNKYTYNCEYLLELCSGRGGDLHKWLFNGIKNVTGYDICDKSIAECRKRLSQISPQSNYNFYQLDLCSENASKIIMSNANSRPFNVVCCNFGVHYFFKSESTFSNLLNILNTCLQDNGLFVVTFMDNKKLEELFARNSLDNCSKEVNNEIAYYIKKNKSGNNLRIVLSGGMSNILSHGSDEYIIDFDLFVKTMKENNFQVIETTLFESLPQNFQLTEVEQDISYLNRFCIFQKLSTKTILPYQVIKPQPSIPLEYKTIQLQKQNLSLHKVSSNYDIIDVLNCIEYKFYKQRIEKCCLETFTDIQTLFNDTLFSSSSFMPVFVEIDNQCAISFPKRYGGLETIIYFTFHKHVVEKLNESNDSELTEYNNWYIVLQNGKILFQPAESDNQSEQKSDNQSEKDLSNSQSEEILQELSSNRLTVKRLKEILLTLGLKTTGKKEDLQKRIEVYCQTFTF